MPHTSNEPNHLLTQLEAAKSRFDPGHPTIVAKLLAGISRLQLTDPHQLIRFHECLLFLRAFPHAVSQIARVENLLNTFHQRVDKLRVANGDMSVFDDFDTSGMAGTTMQDTLSFDVAQWLVNRIPKDVDIAWDDYWEDYQAERARGNTWPRLIPLLEEDADVEANIPWPAWLDAARGRQQPLIWLLSRFAQLPLPARQRAELYDSLRLPLRWRLGNLQLSRTRKWKRPVRFYFHRAGLIQRSEVSLARELAQPAPKLEKLSLAAGEAVMHDIREIMVVRYRELYGTTLGDPSSVVRADIGRGVVMHFWGLPSDRRLPLRAYLAGYTLKNGVPINYIEAIGLCEWIEVGFNTFYTYRQGETAWIYAQALRCLRALTAATCISIYPYQIGQNNEEAIDSGAFWFYRKLGFRPGRPDLQALCEREEMRIAANAQYRTPPRTLRRLAEAHMFYDLSDEQVGVDPVLKGRVLKGRGFSRAVKAAKSSAASAAEGQCGPWDTFSARNIGLLINRRMAREFNGDSRQIRQSSTAAVARALNINHASWTLPQQQTFENWSLVLSLIPDLTRWSPQEKRQLIKIIRAKSAPSEMRYLRQTQHHPRLRAELLRLGSKS
ncbi:MAG TPA: hypothetical protein VFF64_15470 [Candidatus Eremiobacteraceae bacterium]|nr:hypothetical protein [Candidatus Eremiobacteraceae bacterium]